MKLIFKIFSSPLCSQTVYFTDSESELSRNLDMDQGRHQQTNSSRDEFVKEYRRKTQKEENNG
jgi:hypothetical protein